MPSRDEMNRSEWENQDNWTSPGFYFSKRDSRWIVPKRNPALGWTFNLGNPKGVFAMIISFLVPAMILTGVVLFIVLKIGK